MDNYNSFQSEHQGENYDNTFNPPMPTLSSNPTYSRDVKFQLPLDFSPSPHSVLVGRGKVCSDATGNKRLKVLVSTFLDEYSKASSRIEKSITVSKIIDMVREACPVGAFIKLEKGVWWEVSDSVARHRVAAMLRDSLHEQYRSSSKSKQARRKNCKTSSEDSEIEPQFSKPNQTSLQASLVSSFGEEALDWHREEEVGEQIYSPHLTDQIPTRTSIVNHPPFDDNTFARIDAADVFLRKLPQQSISGQMILKGKSETTCGVISDVGNAKDGAADPILYRGRSWPGATHTNNVPSDSFHVLSQQQQLLELQLHQNRRRQWEQQLMYHQLQQQQQQQHQQQQQQQQQQLLHLQQQRLSYYPSTNYGPGSSYAPNMMPIHWTYQRPTPEMNVSSVSSSSSSLSSSHVQSRGVLDPSLAISRESWDGVAVSAVATMSPSDLTKSSPTHSHQYHERKVVPPGDNNNIIMNEGSSELPDTLH